MTTEIEKLKLENKKLKDCSYEEYCALINDCPTENNLVKEWVDMENECGALAEENKKLKDKLDNIVDDYCDFWHDEEVKYLNPNYNGTPEKEKDFIINHGFSCHYYSIIYTVV